MSAKIRDYLSGRLFQLVVAMAALYCAVALALRPSLLILALNGLSLSTSMGVAVAYMPVAGHALRRRTPSRGDVLGAGIFFSGVSGVALRINSVLARDLARPFILNTDFAAASIFIGLMGLLCFLWAPYASEGRVPREKWGLAGMIVAAGVAISFAVSAAHHMMAPSPTFRFE